MSAKHSTIGLVVALSVLLIVFAFMTKNLLEIRADGEGVNASISVSGLDAAEAATQDAP